MRGSMPKEAKPPKSKKLPRKLPEDPIARGMAIMREATEQEVGVTNILPSYCIGSFDRNGRFWRKADIGPTGAEWPLLTQSGHSL